MGFWPAFLTALLSPMPGGRDVKVADGKISEADAFCSTVPQLCSLFVDAFVDHSVGGHVISHDNAEPSHCHSRTGEESSGIPIPTFLEGADRVVVVGDVHGDLEKTRKALQIAGVADRNDCWTGGSSVLVQVGDQLDRGGEELKVLYLLEKLRREAPKSGGAVHILHGNHETGNIDGWFRYATKEGMDEFQHWANWQRMGNRLKKACHVASPMQDPLVNVPKKVRDIERARYAALQPGGPIATRFLASHPSVLVLGDTVFVHGGLLPEHIAYGLERINKEAQDWVLGKEMYRNLSWQFGMPSAPAFFRGTKAVVWLREYSHVDKSKCDCELLKKTLAMLPGVKRMVVGHTIQQPGGINGACDNQVIRVDVGMSKGCYDAPPEVLEISGGQPLRVLTANDPPRLIDAGLLQRARATLQQLLQSAI